MVKAKCVLPFLAMVIAAGQEPATVSGMVVDYETGSPLENVFVRLLPIPVTGVAYGAVTDKAGRFSMPAVRPAKYISTPDLAGYLFAPSMGSNFSLDPGEHFEVLWRMVRPWIITGRVSDEYGEPVRQARIEASGVQGSGEASAITDDRGLYIYRLACAPGSYHLIVSRVDSRVRTYYPGLPSDAGSPVFNAQPGKDAAGIDFHLPAVTQLWNCTDAAPTTDTSDFRRAISGVVLDSVTGGPIRRATVLLSGPIDRAHVARFPTPVRCQVTATNDHGSFSFNDLERGSYYISGWHERYVDERPGVSPYGLDLGEDRAYSVTLKLTPQAVITGRVVDRDGKPVWKAGVVASSGTWGGSALTDDRGEFGITWLREGEYLVTAAIDYSGFPPEIMPDGSTGTNYGLTYYPGTLDQLKATRVQAVPGAETKGIAIQLLPTPVLRISGWAIGRPEFARATVSLRARDGHATFAGSADVSPATRRFVIWRVRPGKYYLVVQYDGATRSAQSVPLDIEIGTKSIDDLILGNRLRQ